MAEIQAFRAIRYDLGRVGHLSDVIAPPYDVIDARLRAVLAAKHPNNVVNVDLPVEEPNEKPGDDRYTRAARRFKEWQRDGILQQDSARSLYVYHQEFEAEGKRHVRRGVMARVKLEPFSSGIIRPHEFTLSGPKLDRKLLLEATATNLSPGFALYEDPTSEVQTLLDAATSGQPPTEAVDLLGVVSRIWPVSDQQVISRVAGLLGPKPFLIADGHHRYETALQYRDDHLGAAVSQPGTEPVRYTMMMLVGMSDPGLLVLPTHRLVTGGCRFSAPGLQERLAKHFDVTVIGKGDTAAHQAWDRLSIEVGQGGLAFGTADDHWLLAKPRDLSIMAELAPNQSDAWRSLSVSVLHRLVLEKLLGGKPECQYVHTLGEVLSTPRHWETAALVPAVDVTLTSQIAAAGEKMPPKSTYFYPKLQTGLLFNSLKTN